jgi:adenylate cyclase
MTADPDDPESVRIGPTVLAALDPNLGGYKRTDAGGYQYLLDYRRPNGSFPSIDLTRALAGEFDPALVRDRIVLLGTRSPSVKDHFQTPTGVLFGDDALVYGAEHHAQAIDQVVRLGFGEARPLVSWSEGLEVLWILFWCLTGSAVGLRVRSPLNLVGTVLLGLGILLGGAYLAFLRSWWIPVVPTTIGGLSAMALVGAYVTQQERADKAKAMNLFGKYVSRRLVDRIWEQRDLFMEGDRPRPQRITVTVMLSDLIGYTTRSEKSEPTEVMDWLGTYMDRMAYLIEKHGGMVNDFLGDGIMASFGVPVPSSTQAEIDQDASNAVRCALEMEETLAELNERWRHDGKPTARMRVGIQTGPAVVGDIGSQDRMKYATVGNTVNTASRLESFDKMSFELEPEQSTCRILIGESTLERLHDRFVSRSLGDHVLKGKGDAVTIHRILGRAPEAGPVDEALDAVGGAG